MNKTELIAAMAEESQMTKKDTEKILTAFTNVVVKGLKNNEKIQIVGFGTFEVINRDARIGRNPATGETMMLNASKTPKFKPSGALKNAVNGGE